MPIPYMLSEAQETYGRRLLPGLRRNGQISGRSRLPELFAKNCLLVKGQNGVTEYWPCKADMEAWSDEKAKDELDNI